MPDGGIVSVLTHKAAPAESSANEAAAVESVPHAGALSPAPPAEGPPLDAQIYQPCRSAMSSGGKAASPFWVLEFERRSPSFPDPLMGWSSSADTLSQIRLKFPSRDAAIAYARRNGITATVVEPHRPKLAMRSYASNFVGKGAVGVSGRVGQPDDG